MFDYYGVEKTEKELAKMAGWNKNLGVKLLMLRGRKDAGIFKFYLKNGFAEDKNVAIMFKNFAGQSFGFKNN